ncbi:hypothetical protein [Streptomyces rhizosphaericus]|uniref:hypothetical protein n=1 Tax=Streptomyces rhizosphaericus TaxID=114699 RepID=UPI003626DD7B
MQDLIKLRNDIAHGRATATPAHRESLDLLLRRFAHRAASSWRATLAAPTSMTYDGSTYTLDVLSFTGAGKPSPGTVRTEHPQVTGRVLLLTSQTPPLRLFPWLVAQAPQQSGAPRCLQFDGLQRTKSGPNSHTPLKYAKADDGEGRTAAGHPGGTWQSLAPWLP